MSNQILIATKNEGKLKEFKQIFTAKGIEVLSLKDVDEDVDVQENGLTFEENARLKADMKLMLKPLNAVLRGFWVRTQFANLNGLARNFLSTVCWGP